MFYYPSQDTLSGLGLSDHEKKHLKHFFRNRVVVIFFMSRPLNFVQFDFAISAFRAI